MRMRHATSLLSVAGLMLPGSVFADADGASERRGVLEEIVVTARKKEERLQDTPIAVTAFTAERLEAYQVDDVSVLADSTPNLTFDTSAALAGSGSTASIYIRGIGSSELGISADPGVGIYVDGVYLARSVGAVLDLIDTERIEVLRGPQGTLFGRNTIGGALNITSRSPEPEFGGSAAVSFGSDRLRRFDGVLNIPFSETLASRISILRTRRDGFVSDRSGGSDFGDDNTFAGRMSLRWQPSDRLVITLRGDATRERENPAPFVLVSLSETDDTAPPNPDGTPALSFAGLANQLNEASGLCPDRTDVTNQNCLNQQFLSGPFASFDGFSTTDPVVNAAASKPFSADSELDVWGTSATLEWEISDSVTLRSITAYRRLDSFFVRDPDHSPILTLDAINDYEQDQTTQELQLFGQAFDDRLDWTLGAYYFFENGDHKDVVEFPIGSIISGGEFENKAVAVFGQGSYAIGTSAELTLGVRYNYERKIFDTSSQRTLSGFDGLGGVGMRLITDEDEATNRDRELTPYVSLSYFWSESLMTYASYSEGFKGGGFEQRVFPARERAPSFEPETARVYEVGVKSTLLDSRMILNAAAFYTDYDDLQISVFDGVAPVTKNAASAAIRGIEAEMTFLPTPEWELDFSLGYLDAQYSEIDAAAVGVGRDNDLVNSPEWSFSASAAYRLELAMGTLTPRLNWSFRSDISNDAINSAPLEEDQVNLFDASLLFEPAVQDWRLMLSARNLTDRTYLVSGITQNSVGVSEAAFARGRTVSASIRWEF